MNTKNLPFKLLAAIGVLFALGVICSSTTAPFANVARDYSPQNKVAAQATATAIAPAIEPTLQYQATVMPELRRVESYEIVETTRNRYEWRRAVDVATAVAKVVALGSFALACVGVGVGVGGFASARGIREVRQAALPPTRQLAEGPHVTAAGTITHTVTGATWQIDAPHDAQPEHARLVSATYEAIPRNVLVDLLQAQRLEWERIRMLESG